MRAAHDNAPAWERRRESIDMESSANFADTIRKMTDAYAEWFSSMTRTPAPGALPWDSGEMRRLAEQWLGVARMMKDGTVSAIEQGFDLWEQQARQVLGAAAGASSVPSGIPAQAWAEHWKKSFDAMLPGGAPWSEALRKQTELLQKTMQESALAWQRLWPSPERKP
jgi:hypothetical protein